MFYPFYYDNNAFNVLWGYLWIIQSRNQILILEKYILYGLTCHLAQAYGRGDKVMNQTHLSYFITVYNYRNISKAAEEIHISRQALSKIINDMEREMDAILFERTQDGLIPTDIGNELYYHAENILHEFEEIQNINYL